ncbi:MAG TPA: hypothetical protein VF281_00090 [Candidatus Saccharimonadales bacterium]
MRTATSTPIYTSSKEANGHIVNFHVYVGMQAFHASRIFDENVRTLQAGRIAIRLPESCKLYDESYDPDILIESTFHQGQGVSLETNRGYPSEKLLAAAEVVAGYMSDPLHERVGLRVRSSSEETILIAYLASDTDLQLLCEEIADAVYDKVAAVTYQYRWPVSMSYFERRDWQNHQLLDF